MEREIRYCTTEDGVSIAYCALGDGPPVVVSSNLFESFTVDHLVPGLPGFYSALARGRMIIRYDPRNVGVSQKGVKNVGVDDLVLDLVAVARAADSGPVSILAMGASGPKVVLFAVRHPDLIDRLVFSSAWTRTLDLQREDTLRAIAELARNNWKVAVQALVARVNSPAYEKAVEDSFLASIDGEAAAEAILASVDTDVSGSLTDVRAPTLVIQQTEHNLIPFTIAQRMAASIPGARLVPVVGSNVELPHRVFLPDIDAFLPKSPSGSDSTSVGTFRTLLFTDLVGHTAMMQRLGDERGRDILREHERITRDVLKANGGTEVKTMGDGFMASFGSVTKAVECAVALQRAFAEREGEPLSVRVGMNAGEPIEEGGDLFGATVILASRIAAKAEGGEILVADAVRGLCSGKGFLFADRGEFVAKGFEEPVRISEVNWRS